MAVSRADTLPRLVWIQRTDILVAIFFLCIVIMLIIPLPALVIDASIALNITLAVVIILSVTYVMKVIEFSVFPSLLLVSTVYRLAIEVSTCRLILGGRGEDIGIVRTFGTFVVGGNIVVGIVIFLILTIIQLLVIVRGTMRVSEVAARFTLDAMPGRQMAIDADLNAGYITEKEAADKRVEIRKEADFYGAMDGATRFVQGDVIAGIIITAINIIGGLAIGCFMRGESISDAFRAYTTYTVGAALSAQIPAFLISISTGLLVSRSASVSHLGSDLVQQLSANPRVLWITSGALAFFMFTPLPKLPLLFLSLGIGALGYLIKQSIRLEEEKALEIEKKKEIDMLKKPESVATLLQLDQMELEVGYGLIPLVEPEQGGDLLDRVTMIRRQTALDLGIIVPPIRIRDNIQLKPNSYALKIRGVEVGKGTLRLDKYLAMSAKESDEKIEGEAVKDPAFGLPAIWVDDEQRETAEKAGYTIADPPSVIATHLTQVIKTNAAELLGRQETQHLIDTLKQNYPSVVSELIPNLLSSGEVQKVLQGLLQEGISIRNLLTILETLADWAGKTKDIGFLIERVRKALSRQLMKQYQSIDGILSVITLDPKLESDLISCLQDTPDGEHLIIDPIKMQGILRAVQEEIGKTIHKQPVILCSPRLRKHIKNLVIKAFPTIGILSYQEISPEVEVQAVGVVKEGG